MPNPRRRERLGALIEEILSDLIRQMKDPRVSGLVSVSRVQVTQDASLARVHVSVMGSEEVRKETLRALEHAQGFLRSKLGAQMSIRHVPELQFQIDRSIEEGDRVLQLINTLEIPPKSEEDSDDE
jgi:ribosome-binding factor A